MDSRKYKNIIKKPEQKLKQSIDKLNDKLSEEDKTINKCLEVLGIINLGIIKLLCKGLRKVYLDNKLIDKLEETFRDIKKTKDENGKTKKLNSFLKKHPQISSKLLWTLLATAVTFGGIKIGNSKNVPVKQKTEQKKDKSSKKENKKDNTNKKEKKQFDINKEYDIKDKKSFKELYDESKPLMYTELSSIESITSIPFSDNLKSKPNTVCVGHWKYPKSGNPTDKKWIQTSDFLKNHRNYKVPAGTHFDYIDGWVENRNCYAQGYNTIYNRLANALQGVNLTPNEFIAIVSIVYNSEALLDKVCKFIKKNHDDPIKCANYIVHLKPKGKGFNTGIKKRHCHEALVYLNTDNYCSYLLSLEMNRKTHSCAPTALGIAPYNAMISDLEKGKLDGSKQLAKLIRTYRYKGNRKDITTLEGLIAENGLESKLIGLEQFDEDTLNIQDLLFIEEINKLYENTLNIYKQARANKDLKLYKQALDGFAHIVEIGYDNASMHNDIAISYFHLGEYEKCIKESEIALDNDNLTNVIKANAYYNMGIAYDTLGLYDKAVECFDNANKNNPKRVYETKRDKAKEKAAVQTAQKKQKIKKGILIGLGALGMGIGTGVTIGVAARKRKDYKKGKNNLDKRKILKNPPRNRNNIGR